LRDLPGGGNLVGFDVLLRGVAFQPLLHVRGEGGGKAEDDGLGFGVVALEDAASVLLYVTRNGSDLVGRSAVFEANNPLGLLTLRSRGERGLSSGTKISGQLSIGAKCGNKYLATTNIANRLD